MTGAQERGIKHQRVAEYLKARELDAVVLTRRDNFAWYTGGRENHVVAGSEIGAASLIVMQDGAVCVCDTIEGPRYETEELTETGIDVQTYAWHDDADARRTWASFLDGRRVQADTPLPYLPEADEAPRGLQLRSSLSGGFDRLRWQLTEAELGRYRELGGVVARELEAVCRSAKRGMSEHELIGSLIGRLQALGVRSPVALVAADDRVEKYRHPIPTGKRVKRYGMVVICGERGGLIACATRLFSFGPLPDELRRKHDAVCRVDAAFIAETRPGRTLGEVFAAGRAAYAEVGFPDEWRLHHQGGSTGYAGREVKAVPDCVVPVLADQAFAWNPSIVGTKSEDTIVVGDGGFEIITETGDWPGVEVEYGGKRFTRPDILVL